MLEVVIMTETERKDVVKSVGFDLCEIVDESQQETYTAEQVKIMIKTYVKTST